MIYNITIFGIVEWSRLQSPKTHSRPQPLLVTICSVGQGFEKPWGSGVRVTRVRVRVRIFIPLTRVRGFFKGYSKVNFCLMKIFIWLQN